MHWFLKLVSILAAFFIFFFFILIVLPKLLPSEYLYNTEMRGLVLQNQVWSGSIRVTGDLITSPGVTITLNPGTEVLVSAKEDKNNLDFLPWHLKTGVNTQAYYNGVFIGEPFWDESQKIQLHFSKLIALGTKEKPIKIRSDSLSGSPYDFNVLKINSGTLKNIIASNYRRGEIGDGVVIQDSRFFDIGECALCIRHANPVIINNVFENALRENIWLDEASPKIENNLFVNQKGVGIKADVKRWGAPVILKNSFEMPQKDAIDILSGGEVDGGVIAFNLFSGNTRVKLACDSKIGFFQNSILGVIVFSQGCGGVYTFGLNYWGIDKVSTILSDKIIKKEGKFKVIIPSVLKTPPSSVGRI